MRSKFRGSALALLLMTSVVSTTLRAAPPVAAPAPEAPAVPAAESSPAVPRSESPSAGTSSDAQSDPQTLAEARELFWKAHALFEKGDYVEALRLFEQTYALRQEPEVLFNLALTHLRLNHCDQARSLYQEYRAKVEPGADSAHPPKELVGLDEHCGPPAPPAPKTTTHVPVPLAITVVKTTPAAPKPAPVPEPATSADAADSEAFPFRTLGWVAVGASAVAFGATVYFVVRQRQAADDFERASGDEAVKLESDAETAADLAVAMGITSGVLAAGGVTLLVVAPSTPAQSAAPPLTEFGLGLQFVGSF